MAEWGLRIWDENGRDINTGFVRVLVKGQLTLAQEQQSGSMAVAVPSGYILDFLVQPSTGTFSSKRRRISISGGTLNVSSASNSDYSPGTYPAFSANVLLFLRR
ncbi:hypothetical protein ACFL9S_15070 [Erwinia sp. AnSW2-5]|uniref:hypothetical protein n=1 Tax=Erwinia sp. AnSW2-5 TaxID=3367692 RepID=UPI003857FB91